LDDKLVAQIHSLNTVVEETPCTAAGAVVTSSHLIWLNLSVIFSLDLDAIHGSTGPHSTVMMAACSSFRVLESMEITTIGHAF
jgi:hypothetical protein